MSNKFTKKSFEIKRKASSRRIDEIQRDIFMMGRRKEWNKASNSFVHGFKEKLGFKYLIFNLISVEEEEISNGIGFWWRNNKWSKFVTVAGTCAATASSFLANQS